MKSSSGKLFHDDFSSDTIASGTWVPMAGKWSISSGVLRGTGYAPQRLIIKAGSTTWTNYVLVFDVKPIRLHANSTWYDLGIAMRWSGKRHPIYSGFLWDLPGD